MNPWHCPIKINMKQHFPDMPPRGLCRICSPLLAGGQFPQNELQSHKENHQHAPRNVYLCSGHVCCRLAPNRVTLSSETQTLRIIGWWRATTRLRQRKSCNVKNQCGLKNDQQKQNLVTFTFSPNPESQNATTLTQKMNFGTGTTYGKRLPNRDHCCSFPLDPPGENPWPHQNPKRNSKNTQILKNRVPSTSIMKQNVPDIRPRGLCRICSPMSVGGQISQNELQNRKKHLPNTSRNVYLWSGNASCIMAPDHSTLPSEMRTLRCHLGDFTQRPACGNNNLARLEIIVGKKVAQNQTITWHRNSTQPQNSNHRNRGAKNEFRPRHHLWQIVVRTASAAANLNLTRQTRTSHFQKINKKTQKQQTNKTVFHHDLSLDKLFKMPWRGLGQNCSSISREPQHNAPETYICVLATCVASWSAPLYITLRNANSTDQLHDRAQRPGCNNNGLAILEINLGQEKTKIRKCNDTEIFTDQTETSNRHNRGANKRTSTPVTPIMQHVSQNAVTRVGSDLFPSVRS